MFQPLYFSLLHIRGGFGVINEIALNDTNVDFSVSLRRKHHIVTDFHLYSKPIQHTGTGSDGTLFTVGICVYIVRFIGFPTWFQFAAISKILPANSNDIIVQEQEITVVWMPQIFFSSLAIMYTPIKSNTIFHAKALLDSYTISLQLHTHFR